MRFKAAASKLRSTIGDGSIMPDATDQGILLPDGTPNWSAIEFDLLCSRCDYNLRTLTLPRCPECGLTFDWVEAIESTRRHSVILFEHAWRVRPIRSWLATTWACLWPTSFWQRVSIHERVRVSPLLFFLASTVISAIMFLIVASQSVAAVLAIFIRSTQFSPYTPQPYLVRTHYQLDRLAMHPRWPFSKWLASFDYRFWLVPIGMLFAILGILVILAVLQQTLTRFRIRRDQLLRVVAYAAPAICLWGCLFLIAFASLLPFSSFAGPIPFVPTLSFRRGWPHPHGYSYLLADLTPLEVAAYLLIIIAVLLAIVNHIGVPLRDYLRLPNPWRLAVIAALTAALLPASILAVLCLTITGNW